MAEGRVVGGRDARGLVEENHDLDTADLLTGIIIEFEKTRLVPASLSRPLKVMGPALGPPKNGG